MADAMVEVRAQQSVGALSGDLVERLITLADRVPDRTLFIELQDGIEESARLTAQSLRDRAAGLAAALREAGVRRGDVALLIASPPAEFMVALFGCFWAGVIAAPIAFPRRVEHLVTRLDPVRLNAGASAIIAGTPKDGSERAVLDTLTGGTLPVIATTDVGTESPPPPVEERDIAYLQYTSGSTRDPRGVIVTHSNLVANLATSRELLDYNEDMVTVSWCPLTHDMGLIMGALPSISEGGLSVLMPPGAFIRKPLTWMQSMDRYRGTHGYSPNFGYDLCVDRSDELQRAALDLSCVQFLVNGAEPVRLATGERFAEAFASSGLRPRAHTPAYGLAESTVCVSCSVSDTPGNAVWVDGAALESDTVVMREPGDQGVRELCLDGRPASEYDVRIVNPQSRKQAGPDQVGELWLAGPSVSPGYWRREQESEEAFGGRLADDGSGPYLRTGDLAFLHDGEIVICGRLKDLIVIHGRNLYPHDIEFVAEESHEAVRRGGSAAFAVDEGDTEALVLVAEIDGEPDEAAVVAAIRAAVLREFDLRVRDVLLVAPMTVPKTSSGKKQRSATRELWRAARSNTQGAPPV
jgi:acyl-CoA synthetase (AMP-forming)/AMP-acid ligase II